MTLPIYTTAALKDLENILEKIREDKPQAALAWIEKIEKKCLLIASATEMGESLPHLGPGVRANVVVRYVIFHRRVNERAEILRVIPGDRNITDI